MKRATLIILIFTTILLLLLDVVAFLFFLLTAVFGSGFDTNALLTLLAMLLLPFIVGGIIGISGWLFYLRRWYGAAISVALVGWILVAFWLSLLRVGMDIHKLTDPLIDAIGGVQDIASGVRADAPTSNISNLEITENPGILLNSQVEFTELKAFGVRLGDPIERIPKACPNTDAPADPGEGHFQCAKGIRILARQGRILVIEFLRSDDGGIPELLGISDESMLRRRLGSPTRFENYIGSDSNNINRYGTVMYSQNGAHDSWRNVYWDGIKNRVSAVELHRSSDAKDIIH